MVKQTCLNDAMMHNAVIMRTIIELPDEQFHALAALCEREKISRAEAIRRALGEMLSRKQYQTREQAFGAWPKKVDSRTLVEKLRKEWDK